MNSRRLDLIWLFLLVATAFTWWLGDTGAAGTVAVLLMLGAAALKGAFIALDFMALREVNRLWPGLVIGWLLLVLVIIVASYLSSGAS
jgi:hypothetical protein